MRPTATAEAARRALPRLDILCVWLLLLAQLQAVAADPRLDFNAAALTPAELGIVVNGGDPVSVSAARDYAAAYGVPAQNIVTLRFPSAGVALTPAQFAPLYQQVRKRMPERVQGLLLTWVQPYRVGCMSITSAFAMGYSAKYCAAPIEGKNCGPTPPNPWFQSSETQPWTRLHLRPAMLLGARTPAAARALIERGQASAGQGGGTAYLLSTSDPARNVRHVRYAVTQQVFQRWLNVDVRSADELRNRQDVMFYFTGLQRVAGLETLHFLPGAVADHLTSYGGQLTDSSQMSALAWIEAGATGSYGTVLEPCAMVQKFPDPPTLLQHYLAGETLMESYWKSVAWPVEGVFVGDPLARPFRGWLLRRLGGKIAFDLPWLRPGRWMLEAAASPLGPFRPVLQVRSRGDAVQLVPPAPVQPWYRLRPVAAS